VGLGQTNNDVLGKWTRMRQIDGAGCLLVRPDRFIAWRCPGRVADPAGELEAVVKNILGF
jgi:2,4-dichlorophenol 6-monooxygenase